MGQAVMGTEIHWLASAWPTVAGFRVGGLWYGPLFGKAWKAARGLTDDARCRRGAHMPLDLRRDLRAQRWSSAFMLDHTLGTYGDPDCRWR